MCTDSVAESYNADWYLSILLKLSLSEIVILKHRPNQDSRTLFNIEFGELLSATKNYTKQQVTCDSRGKNTLWGIGLNYIKCRETGLTKHYIFRMTNQTKNHKID